MKKIILATIIASTFATSAMADQSFEISSPTNSNGDTVHQVVYMNDGDKSVAVATDDYARDVHSVALNAHEYARQVDIKSNTNADNINRISVSKNSDGSAVRVTDANGNYADMASFEVTSDNRKYINEHQVRLNEHDVEINTNGNAITDQAAKLKSESEIRTIVDNNLAKGIDNNTTNINKNKASIDDIYALGTQRDARISQNEQNIAKNTADIKQLGGIMAGIGAQAAIPQSNLSYGEFALGMGGYTDAMDNDAIAMQLQTMPTQNMRLNISVSAAPEDMNNTWQASAGAAWKF